jgi:hypothetical protein
MQSREVLNMNMKINKWGQPVNVLGRSLLLNGTYVEIPHLTNPSSGSRSSRGSAACVTPAGLRATWAAETKLDKQSNV